MHYPAKPAQTEAPILDVIQNRWSPVAFDPTPLDKEQIRSLFEAGRWAQSNYNEQPWRYIYAGKNDPGRSELESLLVEGNAYAKNAGLLLISFGSKKFAKNGKPNRFNLHDTGAASALITLQATSMGLISHQMSGYDSERANALLGVPEEFEPGSMMALGYAGDPKTMDAASQQRDAGPRTRRPQEESFFQGKWPAV
jgi:nitroreductase